MTDFLGDGLYSGLIDVPDVFECIGLLTIRLFVRYGDTPQLSLELYHEPLVFLPDTHSYCVFSNSLYMGGTLGRIFFCEYQTVQQHTLVCLLLAAGYLEEFIEDSKKDASFILLKPVMRNYPLSDVPNIGSAMIQVLLVPYADLPLPPLFW